MLYGSEIMIWRGQRSGGYLPLGASKEECKKQDSIKVFKGSQWQGKDEKHLKSVGHSAKQNFYLDLRSVICASVISP